jgi:ankyrin repeat protein
VTHLGRWRILAVLLLAVAAGAVVVALAVPQVRARIALWRRGVPITDDLRAVRAASRADDVGTLALLLEAGADLGAATTQGETPLHVAAAAGAGRAVSFLLAHGAPVDGAPSKRTPLALAVEAGHLDVARVLLKHGADPLAPTGPAGRPAPLHAARTGDVGTMRLLLGFGVDPNVVGRDGLPAIVHAVARNDEPVTRELLAAGATLDVDPPGADRSLLEQAIRDGRTSVVKLLLGHGADPAALSREGQPLLPLAVALGRPDAAMALLDAGADVDTALVPEPSEEFLALVPGKYARFYLTRDEGLTALMVAVLRGDQDLARMLLAHGASLGPTRGRVKYPLGMAADRRDIEMMQILLGRDPAEAARTRRIVISLSTQQATLLENEQPTFRTRVSTGRKGYATPRGEFVITDKRRRWRSTLYDAEMPYFMRLSGSDVGLHAGVVPSRPASHGCIRLPAASARTLYQRMRLGDPVTIVR